MGPPPRGGVPPLGIRKEVGGGAGRRPGGGAAETGGCPFARPEGGLRPDARILQGVDEDGKGDVPCAENCGWMVPT